MRKIKNFGNVFVIVSIMMLIATGCANDTVKEKEGSASLRFTIETYPNVDGTTASIPLSELVAATLMDLPIEEARQYVNHSKTHGAFMNLVAGKADFIFASLPSEEHLSAVAEIEDEFELIPIRREGFVFLVNKKNPVDSLTIEEIQGIYSGEITNWSEVGGEDLAIAPFQRPENSGSQTGILNFVMKEIPLMEPPMELVAGAMDILVDVVASYDNSAGAIGYSYYYYVSNMHINEDVKLLKIDGIMPGKDTISTAEYPLTEDSYIIYLKSQPEDSKARQVAAWLLSEEGQRIVEEAGYVRLAAE